MCCGESFLIPEFGDSVLEESILVFGDRLPEFKHAVGQIKESFQAKTQLGPSIRFDNVRVCDRQTDTDRHRVTANAAPACAQTQLLRFVVICCGFVHIVEGFLVEQKSTPNRGNCF